MFTIALIGGDGAGKTTIANELIATLPWQVKYLYMGQSTISGNSALPTTKIARFFKFRMHKKTSKDEVGEIQPAKPTSNELHYSKKPRNWIWKVARLLNRLLEAYWRQMLTFFYCIRGYMVLYDRHILFDAAPKNPSSIKMSKILDRLEYIIFHNFLPQPDLVIFLDAPAEVLYRRKGEATIKHLNSRREAILGQARHINNFVRIDASLPIEQVLAEVVSQINYYYATLSAKRKRFLGLKIRKKEMD